MNLHDFHSTRRGLGELQAAWEESHGRKYSIGEDPKVDLFALLFWGSVLRWVGIGYEQTNDRERQQRDYDELKSLVETAIRGAIEFPAKWDLERLKEGRYHLNFDGQIAERLRRQEQEDGKAKRRAITARIRKGSGLGYVAEDLLWFDRSDD